MIVLETLEFRIEVDHRWDEYATSQPVMPVALIGGYLFMIYVWGPRFMKSREPFQITGITRTYNVLQVFANLYFSAKIFDIFYVKMGNSFTCAPPDRRTDPLALEYLAVQQRYWWVRVSDFLDTLFFILRRKQRQVSFLHVFHHVVVVAGAWISAKFGFSNLIAFSMCLNALVHVIMYSYYFLSTLGPAVHKYLWWKKHLTKLQIIQFLILIVHVSVPLFTDCGYPKEAAVFWLLLIATILLLFVNFYAKSYVARKIA